MVLRRKLQDTGVPEVTASFIGSSSHLQKQFLGGHAIKKCYTTPRSRKSAKLDFFSIIVRKAR